MPNKSLNSYNIIKCLECKDEPEFEIRDIEKHLEEVHKIPAQLQKANRRMTMHLDARDWFETDYECEVAGLHFIQFVRVPRRGNDPLRGRD